MAEHDRELPGFDLRVAKVQIGAAHGARVDPQAQLPGLWLGVRELGGLKRLALMFQDSCTHADIMTPGHVSDQRPQCPDPDSHPAAAGAGGGAGWRRSCSPWRY